MIFSDPVHDPAHDKATSAGYFRKYDNKTYSLVNWKPTAYEKNISIRPVEQIFPQKAPCERRGTWQGG